MNSLPSELISNQVRLQTRLLYIAAGFVIVFAVILTLSPAVRYNSWLVAYRWHHWIGVLTWGLGFLYTQKNIIRRLPDNDPYLLPSAGLLSGWGLLTIYRLDPLLGIKQTIWLAVCLVWLNVLIGIPNLLDLLRRYKYLLLTAGLSLTAITLLFGTYPGGTGPGLWLGFGSIYLQPSELLKLLLVLYLSAYLAGKHLTRLRILEILKPTFVIILIATALLLVQRDLGTTALILIIYTICLYIATGRLEVLLISFFLLALAGLSGYALYDVIRLRIEAWLNPWLDPSGRSYQIVQSLLAVAAGGVIGQGPGLGSPGVVPVAHSDFIFAAIAEETGLAGSVGLLMIFGLLVSRGFILSLKANTHFKRYLAAGLTASLIVQAILIIGGNLRLLPLTGVTLPFLSYGGSSLLTSFTCLALIMMTGNEMEEDPAPLVSAKPQIVLSGILLLGIFTLGLANAWWSYIRADSLLSRTDNPRRGISDRFVQRGALLDRANRPINFTEGTQGSYVRRYIYPSLATTTGYTSPAYGQAGLEAALDGYLRGLQGAASSTIWWNHLLFGQPPAGIDVRLSIDLNLQAYTDKALSGKKGAAVLLNARTGEILAISSSPGFDPSTLDKQWKDLVNSPDTPLLNRAVQGLYPANSALGPFILSTSTQQGGLPTLDAATLAQASHTCALPVPTRSVPDWGALISSGCEQAGLMLASNLSPLHIQQVLSSYGLTAQPELLIPVAKNPNLPVITSSNQWIEDGLLVTPLQMAIACAALSNGGKRPSPLLAMAVHTPHQGWVVLASKPAESISPNTNVEQTVSLLARTGTPFWESIGKGSTPSSPVTWYLGGTTKDWYGQPVALAVLLEEDNPLFAQQAGRSILQQILNMP